MRALSSGTSDLHQDRILCDVFQATQCLKTYENWSAAQRGTGVLRQKRFPCSVSRIPYTCQCMNNFDLALLIATGGCVYDVYLSSFATKSISKVDRY